MLYVLEIQNYGVLESLSYLSVKNAIIDKIFVNFLQTLEQILDCQRQNACLLALSLYSTVLCRVSVRVCSRSSTLTLPSR